MSIRKFQVNGDWIENKHKRLPRKLKKELKKRYKKRYGITWLKCNNLIEQYYWFYKNPFDWDMKKQLYEI